MINKLKLHIAGILPFHTWAAPLYLPADALWRRDENEAIWLSKHKQNTVKSLKLVHSGKKKCFQCLFLRESAGFQPGNYSSDRIKDLPYLPYMLRSIPSLNLLTNWQKCFQKMIFFFLSEVTSLTTMHLPSTEVGPCIFLIKSEILNFGCKSCKGLLVARVE